MFPYSGMDKLSYVHPMELLDSKENEQTKITHSADKSHKRYWVKEAWHKRLHIVWFHFIMYKISSPNMMLEVRVVFARGEGFASD